jgi:hypothetical protein
LTFDRSKLSFNPRNHGHYYDGERLLGVTTALSSISKGDGLLQWAANCACDYARAGLPFDAVDPNGLPYISADEETFNTVLLGAKYAWRAKKQEAADIGTQAHHWIEAYLRGEDPSWPEDPHVAKSCEAALKWIREHDWQTVKIEHQIFIPDLMVGGICDWYATIDGVPCVPDWKTSKALRTEYAYQTAAYLRALEGEFGVSIPNRWLIRIDKETGEFDARLLPEADIPKDYAAFVAAVTLYRREAEIKKQWTENS